jgi:hypothetical protein
MEVCGQLHALATASLRDVSIASTEQVVGQTTELVSRLWRRDKALATAEHQITILTHPTHSLFTTPNKLSWPPVTPTFHQIR